MKTTLIYSILYFLLFPSITLSNSIPFDLSSPNGWKEKSFKGNTTYSLIEENNRTILRAESNKAASALLFERTIDLRKTPYLNWSWRVERVLENLDEKTKEGDDYAARVYILFKTSFINPYPYSMSYVWSGSATIGDHWNNAYTDRVVMLALQNNNNFVGQWRTEKRNIREDIRQFFGKEIDKIEGVAIMTDTDNSQQHIISYYGELYFSMK